MSAPIGNKFASKPRGEKNDSVLHLACKRREKSAWVKAAHSRGMKLTPWVVQALNDHEELRLVLATIIAKLPPNRDWLDPFLEARAIAVLKKFENAASKGEHNGSAVDSVFMEGVSET